MSTRDAIEREIRERRDLMARLRASKEQDDRHMVDLLAEIEAIKKRDGERTSEIQALARAVEALSTAAAVLSENDVEEPAAAKSSGDENAYATATNLKKCFPKGSVSGGVKATLCL